MRLARAMATGGIPDRKTMAGLCSPTERTVSSMGRMGSAVALNPARERTWASMVETSESEPSRTGRIVTGTEGPGARGVGAEEEVAGADSAEFFAL